MWYLRGNNKHLHSELWQLAIHARLFTHGCRSLSSGRREALAAGVEYSERTASASVRSPARPRTAKVWNQPGRAADRDVASGDLPGHRRAPWPAGMEALSGSESHPPGGRRTKAGGHGGPEHSATLAADPGGNHRGRSHEFAEMDRQVHAHDGRRVDPPRTSRECDDGVALFGGDGILLARQCQKHRGGAASGPGCAIPLHQPASEVLPAEWRSGDFSRHQEKRADWSLSQCGPDLAATGTSSPRVGARLSQPSRRQGHSLWDL